MVEDVDEVCHVISYAKINDIYISENNGTFLRNIISELLLYIHVYKIHKVYHLC